MPRAKNIFRGLHTETIMEEDFPDTTDLPPVDIKNISLFSSKPLLEGVSEEIRDYIHKLEEENKDNQTTIKNMKEEVKSKLLFISDLQTRYDECFDLIVTLQSRIYQLESSENSGTTPNDSQKRLSDDNNQLKKHIYELNDEMKLWRVRAKVLDVDKSILQSEIEELKKNVKEFELRESNKIENNPGPRRDSKPNLELPENKKKPDDVRKEHPRRLLSRRSKIVNNGEITSESLPQIETTKSSNRHGHSTVKQKNFSTEKPVTFPSLKPTPPEQPKQNRASSGRRRFVGV